VRPADDDRSFVLGILPLIFALVIANSATSPIAQAPAFGSLGPWASTLILMGLSLLPWGLLNALIAMVLRRRAGHAALAWWESGATAASLLIFAWWCYGLHWPDRSPSHVLQLVPFLLLMLVHWRALGAVCDIGPPAMADDWSGDEPRQRRHDERGAWGMVKHRLSMGVLPALVALVLFDLFHFALRFIERNTDSESTPTLMAILSFAMPISVLILMPPIVVRLWGAKPMPDGAHRQLLAEGCERMHVAVSRIMRWPAAAGRFYNAAVMGLIPRLRYVLFSDDLLRDLPPEQLLGVLGHELGHIRHKHLWFYLIFLFACSLWSILLLQPVEMLLRMTPPFDQLPRAPLSGLAMLLIFGLLLRVCFGVISRACERQADLAGVELAGDTRPMQDALRSVALLSGQPLHAPSWRHASIAERVAFLAAVGRDPALATQHHRRVRRLRWGTIAMLLLAPLLIGFAPWTQIIEPELQEAFEAAEEGRPAALRAILHEATPDERTRIAIEVHGYVFGQQDPAARCARAELMRAVLDHPTGVAQTDATFGNDFLYSLMTDCDPPAEQDLRRGEALLSSILAAATGEAALPYLDTAGTIAFRLGDRERAARLFRRALAIAYDEDDDAAFIDLLQRRVAAAEAPDAELPLEQ